MRTTYKFVGLLTLFLCGIILVKGDDNLTDKCGAEFQKVASCLTYATGKAAVPSKECCIAAADIKDKDPVCLCFIVEQIHKGSSPELKSMGIQEDKLLQLPSACKLTNASISDCPKLLNIPPSSPDYAIFTNTSTVSKTPIATPAGASSSPGTSKDSSDGFKNGPQLSVCGTIVAAAVVTVILSAIPRDLLVYY